MALLLLSASGGAAVKMEGLPWLLGFWLLNLQRGRLVRVVCAAKRGEGEDLKWRGGRKGKNQVAGGKELMFSKIQTGKGGCLVSKGVGCQCKGFRFRVFFCGFSPLYKLAPLP